MKNLIKTDFDSVFNILSECYLTEDIIQKNIDRYIIPQNVEEDNGGNIKVRADSLLPMVSWRTLKDFSPIEKNESRVEVKNESGIYVIKNNITNQLYFGKASSFMDRVKAHDRGKPGDSIFLHAAVNYAREHDLKDKDGNFPFSWAILKLVEKDRDTLNTAEQEAISTWGTYTSIFDYNLTPGGDGGREEQFTEQQFNDIENRLRMAQDDFNDWGIITPWAQIARDLNSLWSASSVYENCVKKSIDRTWVADLSKTKFTGIYTVDVDKASHTGRLACIIDETNEQSFLNNKDFLSITQAIIAILQIYKPSVKNEIKSVALSIFNSYLSKKGRVYELDTDFNTAKYLVRLDDGILSDGETAGAKIKISDTNPKERKTDNV